MENGWTGGVGRGGGGGGGGRVKPHIKHLKPSDDCRNRIVPNAENIRNEVF